MKTDLRYLFERFLERESTAEELRELFVRFGTEDEQVLRGLISGELERERIKELIPDPELLGRLYRDITARIHAESERKMRYRRALKIAAITL